MAAFTRTCALLISLAGACDPATKQSSLDTLKEAHRKMALVETDRAAPGRRVTFTAAELAAYAHEQAQVIAPDAVRDTTLDLSPGVAEATATINFLHLRNDGGKEAGWILTKLLDGQRPVRVRVRIQSAAGRARVDVERVEISGVIMEGRALEFLLRQFVIPSFPEAQVGEWFTLGHRIESLQVRQGSVDVHINRNGAYPMQGGMI